MELYHQTSFKIAKQVTRSYSTSFYLATRLLEKDIQAAIHGVYGFVRFADEIVDTFHGYNKEELINKFETDLKQAIEEKISLNPVLHAFQLVINQYEIPYELVDSFLISMKMDLQKQNYQSKEETEAYVYGSANVVGLMCLKIFTKGDVIEYERLKNPAEMLGSAFQKVNFLRDLRTDMAELNRNYFSELDGNSISNDDKQKLIDEIEEEFKIAYQGIRELPGRSKLAVLTAYYYYLALLRRIKRTQSDQLMSQRISVPNFIKIILMIRAMINYKLRRI
jgi:phytoene/squalene synthetase